MKKTLIGIFSHSGANDIVKRHWPYYTLADCAIWGIGRTDTKCVWPFPMFAHTNIGKEGYIGQGNLCQRLVDAMGEFATHPVFGGFTDLCLIEADAIFTYPLPEHQGGLVSVMAGGQSSGFKSRQYFHTPWWVDKVTAYNIHRRGQQLLINGDNEHDFPDRFLGLICDQDTNIKVREALAFSVNAIDTGARIEQARRAVRDASAYYVHGIKTPRELEYVSDLLPDLCQCPNCGYWIEDNDGFGCIAHLKSVHRMGCGFCTHPNVTDGKCGICSKEMAK